MKGRKQFRKDILHHVPLFFLAFLHKVFSWFIDRSSNIIMSFSMAQKGVYKITSPISLHSAWRYGLTTYPLLFFENAKELRTNHTLFLSQHRQMAAGFPCEIVRAEVDADFSKEQLVDLFISSGKTISANWIVMTKRHVLSIKPLQGKNVVLGDKFK